MKPRLAEKELEELSTKAEEAEVEVELPEDKVTLELILKIRDCVVT